MTQNKEARTHAGFVVYGRHLDTLNDLSDQKRDDRPTMKYDALRGSSADRGYGYRWQQARLRHLEANPLCVMCASEGRVVEAQVVDHIKPHKGNQTLFWSASNWQSLCKRHHDSDKQLIEAGKAPRRTIGRDGWPAGG